MDASTAGTDAARPYHKGNVSTDLLAAAARIMRAERVEDISIRRLAREVGVTPGNFYNHFESLEDLLFTLGAAGFDDRSALIKRVMRKEKSRKRRAIILVNEFVELAMREPELFRVMFGKISEGASHKLMGPSSVESFRLFVEAVQGEDIYRVDDLAWSLEHCQTAYSLFSLGYGLARHILEKSIRPQPNTPEGRAKLVESMVGAFVDGSCGAGFGNDTA